MPEEFYGKLRNKKAELRFRNSAFYISDRVCYSTENLYTHHSSYF